MPSRGVAARTTTDGALSRHLKRLEITTWRPCEWPLARSCGRVGQNRWTRAATAMERIMLPFRPASSGRRVAKVGQRLEVTASGSLDIQVKLLELHQVITRYGITGDPPPVGE